MPKRRHPAQVTADRLGNHVETYYDFMDGADRDDISRVGDSAGRYPGADC